MPARTYRKRPYKKRKTYQKRKTFGRPTRRPLAAPNPYAFKRTISQVLKLDPTSTFWQTDGNNIGKVFKFTLSDLAQQGDFTNLFKYYRIKGARCRMYFSNTQSGASGDPSPSNQNQQMLITIDRNLDGDLTNPAQEENYLQSQTCKRRMALGGDRRPIDLYMPLKQLNNTIASSIATVGSLQSPKWLPTDSPDVEHFGYNVMCQRVDGAGFSNGSANYQVMRMITTLYFECKKVE